MCVCIYRDQNDVNKINLFAYLVITFITMNRNSCFMYHVLPTKEHLLSLCKVQQSIICITGGVREFEAELK